MSIDLHTLYLLAIGTLLVSAGMLFLEHRSSPRRDNALRLLAIGFAVLAVGCVMALLRRDLPGAVGSATSNLVIIGGYLWILGGIAALNGRRHLLISAGLLIATALAWAAWGGQRQAFMWSHAGAIPIAIASGLATWEIRRYHEMGSPHSRRIVMAATGIHALLYAARALLLPWLAALYGTAALSLAGKITIYEGVLYSVILPMALLKLIRDETHGQLLRESQTDYLTRLGNRKWFFEQGAGLIDGGPENRPISVLAFDLDRFKSINDAYGHHIGDMVLKSFAEIAQNVLGSRAILARMGGEEFAALLSGDDARRAGALGETIARRFAETIPDSMDGIGIPTTVSVGLAQFDDDIPTLADSLAAADQALYRAKELGGNRLEAAAGEAQTFAN